MTYKELNLASPVEATPQVIKIGDKEIEVKRWLPIRERIAFVEFMIDNTLDVKTGRFNPVHTEVFFHLALVRWYARITFEETDDLLDAYDALDSSGVFDSVIEAMGQEEYHAILDLVNTAMEDIASYNNSFAGMVQIASASADGLDSKLDDILGKIKNKEGIELLSEIKNVVGTD